MPSFRIGSLLGATTQALCARARGAHGGPARGLRATVLLVGVLAAAACQDTAAPEAPPVGGVSLSLEGLPDGANATVLLSKGTSSRTASGSETIDGLDVGAWIMSANSVVVNGVTYEPSPAISTVNIAARSVGSARVVWTPTTGALQLAVLGLPIDVPANVVISGINVSRTVTASSVVTGLPPGLYAIVVRDVRAPDGTMRGEVLSQAVSISASAVPVSASITYRPAPAAVDVVVAGLPSVNAALTLISPAGLSTPVGGSTRLVPVSAGRWQLLAATVQANGFTYAPTPAVHDTSVSAGDTLRLPVNYAVSTGALAIAITGLPVGATGSVRVSGPNAYDRVVPSTTTLTDLAPGAYVVSADSVVRTGLAWRPSQTSQQVTVSASMVAAPATVSYTAVTGTLVVTMSGVPNGANGSARIMGPYGFDRTVTANTILTSIAAGPYTIVAASFAAGGLTYAVTPATLSRTVAIAGRDSVDMRYAAASGSAQITVTGLPNGTNAALTLTGNAQSLNITGSTTLPALGVGAYTLTAAAVNVSGLNYVPTPTTQNFTVANGAQSSATVAYAVVVTGGSLQVTVSGLPNGTNGALTLSNGTTTLAITSTITLAGLAAGSYTLTAASVSASSVTYNPTPTSQNVTITNGAQSAATVTYVGVSALIDFVIDQAVVTQATQKLDGSVALVAGRDALLRVFARADRANTATPTVRARIYDGATLVQTITLTGPAAGVPLAVTEGTLSSSWNTVISGANVRTALRILVDIDPTNTVAEGDEANNSWPSSGTPQNVAVNAVPAFNVRFVPVTVGPLTGNVSAGNMNSFLTTTRLQWPVGTINADVRAPFTSSADTITSNDSNGHWLTVLSEINSLRSADGAPATTHYYGVLKVGYSSGIAGYGYVPGRAAIGWDHLPSGDGVAAHEWGHNFNRPHAPCGGVASADPLYPYAGGIIGAVGWNSTTGALLPTTHKDLMGYCSPNWVSDYNWGRVMTYRQSAGAVADASVNGAGLLVWGRIVNGTVLLEPAFRITAPRSAASVRPTHVVEALDADGNLLLELPISADRVDHVTDHDERHFAAVVPWTATLEDALTRLRVRDLRSPLVAGTRASASAVAERRVRGAPRLAVAMPDPQVVTEAAPAGRVRVRWDQTRYPMAMVRDAASGQIMGYVRQSGDGVVSGGRRLEVVLSDGVRSVVKPTN